MTNEQLNLGITPEVPEPKAFDAQAVADHIGKHATRNPYASKERRAGQIATRYAATHTPDTLPPHLKPAMEAAEANFAKTAPGAKKSPTPVTEAYTDPRNYEVHEIDPDRPFTLEDAAELEAERQQIEKAKADARKGLPKSGEKPDERHISLVNARNHGYFD